MINGGRRLEFIAGKKVFSFRLSSKNILDKLQCLDVFFFLDICHYYSACMRKVEFGSKSLTEDDTVSNWVWKRLLKLCEREFLIKIHCGASFWIFWFWKWGHSWFSQALVDSTTYLKSSIGLKLWTLMKKAFCLA